MNHEKRDQLQIWWNAAVFGAGSYFLGATLLSAFIIMALITTMVFFDYGRGRRAIYMAGFVLLCFVMLVISGAVPHPSKWPSQWKLLSVEQQQASQ